VNPGERGDPIQRRALDEPRSLTLQQIAEDLGISFHTLESYRLRRREMPVEFRKQLAKYLRSRAEKLSEVASQLDRSAK
jgi:hypothetical protein